MNDKLSNEQKQKLLNEFVAVLGLDVLRQTDALALVEVLVEACRREEADILDATKPASDILQ